METGPGFICPDCHDDHRPPVCGKPALTGIDFIRPRIVHPDGWYYRPDLAADTVANNAIDDIEVCLERIDALEAENKRLREEVSRLQSLLTMFGPQIAQAKSKSQAKRIAIQSGIDYSSVHTCNPECAANDHKNADIE